MTKEIRFYNNREEYRADKSMSNFRSLHQDFEDDKLKITWVNGSDDPDNQPRKVISMTERQFIKQLGEAQGIRINFSFKDRVKGILGF